MEYWYFDGPTKLLFPARILNVPGATNSTFPPSSTTAAPPADEITMRFTAAQSMAPLTVWKVTSRSAATCSGPFWACSSKSPAPAIRVRPVPAA